MNAGGKTTAGSQKMVIADYSIMSSMNSRSFFPDPTLAGSNTIIICTGMPETGSEATSLKINFVQETALYPKPEYITATKTIYITMPLNQYAVIINQLEKTVDKTSDKKLRAIYLDDATGGSIGIVQMFNSREEKQSPQKKADGPAPLASPPPATPVKQ